MNIAVLLASDSSCHYDVSAALVRANMTPIEFFGDESADALRDCQGIVVMRTFSSLDHPFLSVITQQNGLGKPILGLAEGAACLVATGLIPGLEDNQIAITLDFFSEEKVSSSVTLFEGYQWNAFTRHAAEKKSLAILPAKKSHFIIPPALLMEMQYQGQTVFYEDDVPVVLSNKVGNVMAVLPAFLNTDENDFIFHSMREYITEGHVQCVQPMHYFLRRSGWM